MASQNRLLGINYEDGTVSHLGHGFTQERTPAWRYHKEKYPKGKVCMTDQQLEAADAEGAVDHPGKLFRLPGLEHIYDTYHAPAAVAPEVVPSIEKTEDEIRAEILKAESDAAEAKLIEDQQKAEEKAAKLICDVCGKKHTSVQACRMHKMSAHKVK